MAKAARTILVTGFLGAGKSQLIAHVREHLERMLALRAGAEAEDAGADALPHDLRLLEASGRAFPATELDLLGGAASVVAVADAANLCACLEDAAIGPLVAAQLRAGGLVVLGRTDQVSAGPARAALATVTDAPVFEMAGGVLPPDAIARLLSLPACLPEASPAPVAFAEWHYAGPAEVGEAALDRLLAERPRGLYRLTGQLRGPENGLEVDVAGRVRQTRPIPQPSETSLTAIGPKAAFRPDRMALLFTEAVSATGYQTGLFSCR